MLDTSMFTPGLKSFLFQLHPHLATVPITKGQPETQSILHSVTLSCQPKFPSHSHRALTLAEGTRGSPGPRFYLRKNVAGANGRASAGYQSPNSNFSPFPESVGLSQGI